MVAEDPQAEGAGFVASPLAVDGYLKRAFEEFAFGLNYCEDSNVHRNDRGSSGRRRLALLADLPPSRQILLANPPRQLQ
jgi:hypothetical protein